MRAGKMDDGEIAGEGAGNVPGCRLCKRVYFIGENVSEFWSRGILLLTAGN